MLTNSTWLMTSEHYKVIDWEFRPYIYVKSQFWPFLLPVVIFLLHFLFSGVFVQWILHFVHSAWWKFSLHILYIFKMAGGFYLNFYILIKGLVKIFLQKKHVENWNMCVCASRYFLIMRTVYQFLGMVSVRILHWRYPLLNRSFDFVVNAVTLGYLEIPSYVKFLAGMIDKNKLFLKEVTRPSWWKN